jgi:hypothetical protein
MNQEELSCQVRVCARTSIRGLVRATDADADADTDTDTATHTICVHTC